MMQRFEIFLVCPPGLESYLQQEALACGFSAPKIQPGGVRCYGGWAHVWRANRELRCATRVLLRWAQFRAEQLNELQRQAMALAWDDILPAGTPVAVQVTCRKSRIYHSGAAKQRLEQALEQAALCRVSSNPLVSVYLRIERDVCTISLDTSGAALYQRGYKQAVAKAPMRENLAALFLRAAGFQPDQPLVDPMCGSGTFVIEAAQAALGYSPGAHRDFAYQHLLGYEAAADRPRKTWQAAEGERPRFFGFDRNEGAIKASRTNAERAGVADITQFTAGSIADLRPPCTQPGLVICNPPYGLRIAERKALFALYASFGQVMQQQFAGWRVAMLTPDSGLAKATKLAWTAQPLGPFDHGGVKLYLFQTEISDRPNKGQERWS